MLVRAKLVTQEQLEGALVSQKESGRRLGEEMVALGYLSELQVTQILSNQLSVPWVDLRHVEFSRELLNLVTPEFAHEQCLIPIYVRHVRSGGDALFVAMDDPTNEDVIAQLVAAVNMPVKAMVAPPTDIREAVSTYYFGRGSVPEVTTEEPPDSSDDFA